MFIEEFIRFEGINKIMALTRISDGNILTATLKCLSYTLVYLNGVEYLKQRPYLFVKIYELITNQQSLEIKNQVIGILSGICRCMSNAFENINKAAINNARRNNQSPYAVLV